MADVQPTSLELRLPPDPQLLRVLRLVASGLASLAQLDLAATEEVRVAVDELGAAMMSLSTGDPIDLTFELTPTALCVEGSTPHREGAVLEIDPLTERMLDEVTSAHDWSVRAGRAVGRIEKHLPQLSSR